VVKTAAEGHKMQTPAITRNRFDEIIKEKADKTSTSY